MEKREMPVFTMTEVEAPKGVIGNQYWVDKRREEMAKVVNECCKEMP